jgi:hypothetical protein
LIPTTATNPWITYDMAFAHRDVLLQQSDERRRAAAVRAGQRRHGPTVDPLRVWRWFRESLLRRGLAQAGR